MTELIRIKLLLMIQLLRMPALGLFRLVVFPSITKSYINIALNVNVFEFSLI